MYAMRPFKNKLTDEQIREAVAFYANWGMLLPLLRFKLPKTQRLSVSPPTRRGEEY